jgi:hypothetical protein
MIDQAPVADFLVNVKSEIKHSAFCALGVRVLGANMGCKLSVALRLEDLLHFS